MWLSFNFRFLSSRSIDIKSSISSIILTSANKKFPYEWAFLPKFPPWLPAFIKIDGHSSHSSDLFVNRNFSKYATFYLSKSMSPRQTYRQSFVFSAIQQVGRPSLWFTFFLKRYFLKTPFLYLIYTSPKLKSDFPIVTKVSFAVSLGCFEYINMILLGLR